jgi:hypothetical protein
MSKYLNDAVANLAKQFADNVERAKKYAEQMDSLEQKSGLTLVTDSWKVRYQSDLEVSLATLATIRKVVGRFEITGKSAPSDFDRTHEICVSVKPRKVEFDQLSFTYRTKYRPGKCVVETYNSTYKSLVCKT